jgi:PAS domain S-box-containing protein
MKASQTTTLRQKAEKQLKNKLAERSPILSEPDILKLIHELEVHHIELEIQNQELINELIEKKKLADELAIANLQLIYQNEEKQKRADELAIVNLELIYQNEEKQKSADELAIANLELIYQNTEKQKRADELIIISTELAIQNERANHERELTEANENLLMIKVALHETNDYLENLISFSNTPIIIYSLDLKITRFNHASELLTGLTENEVLGFPIKIIFPLALFSAFLAMIRQPVHGKLPEMVELKIMHRDKSIRTVLWNSTAIFEKNDPVPTSYIAQIQDITERKQAEESLKQSEERYRALVDWTPYAIVVHCEMKIIYANPAAVKMFGATSEKELTGTPILNRLHPDYHQRLKKRIQSAIDNNIDAPLMEVKYFKLDGTIIDAEVQGTFIIYDGKPCVHTAIRETTERNRIEQSIRENEARYGSMISNISDVIAIMGADGIMKYKSANIEKWFGWLPEERIGTSGFSTIHPEDLEYVQKVFYSLLGEENSVKTLEFRYECKDGSYKPIELTASNLLNDPVINGVLLNYRDITDRRKAKEELVKLSTRLKLATRTSGIGVWDYDIVDNTLLWDEQMFALYGIDESDFTGIYPIWLASLHPDDLERCNTEIQMAIRREKEFDTEFRVVWPDGTIHSIRALAAVQCASSNHPIRMIGTNWDITEQKNSEVALLQAMRDSQQASKSKSVFLANMSHEIRTPMNAIIGFSQLLSRELLSDKQKDYVVSIHRSGDHLLKLINDILELSKIEAGRLVLNPSNTDLHSLFADINMMFKEQAQSKNLKLIFETDPDLPEYVIVDGNKLRQIMINLIGNAIKFTTKGGIAVRARADQSEEHNDSS